MSILHLSGLNGVYASVPIKILLGSYQCNLKHMIIVLTVLLELLIAILEYIDRWSMKLLLLLGLRLIQPSTCTNVTT